MAQRSPYNDRYKVDQKGKTRRSASAAKPKRSVADLTPGESAKKPAKKTSAWSRAMAASKSSGGSSSSSGSSSKTSLRAAENTPRGKRLRRIWWWLWGGALAMAVGLWVVQEAAKNAGDAAGVAASAASNATTATVEAAVNAASGPWVLVVSIGWVLWIAAMGGAFYLEFGPIRKERAAAFAAAQSGSKAEKKTGRSTKPKATKVENPVAAASDNDEPAESAEKDAE